MNKVLRLRKREDTFLAIKLLHSNINEVLEFIGCGDGKEFATLFDHLIVNKDEKLLSYKIGEYLLKDEYGSIQSCDQTYVDQKFYRDGLVKFDYFENRE